MFGLGIMLVILPTWRQSSRMGNHPRLLTAFLVLHRTNRAFLDSKP